MQKLARSIDTNQAGVHQNLQKVVEKYLNSHSLKPLSAHTQAAFMTTKEWLGPWQGELIFDSCCGVGESTSLIASAHPHAKIIGIDKSAARIDKHHSYAGDSSNYLLVRADLHDFWRLAVLEGWQLSKHFILYPNPYPKSSQLQNRWYASSAFPDILKLAGQLEVRSNWQLYIEEFKLALKVAGIKASTQAYKADTPMTPFERKYWHSGQSSWQLLANLLQD
ncbi:MAG: SAM-dependent methyltransferase [Paraglaciecola sp.]|uniref:tRNA (guanine(46)-N(7))-methyltransferase TrmB n=1 Tax=Paraglaciecola sp. TaxID=1920173 RepID=UPI00273FECF3|nr:SAM-dependent methyltransferase [Paraglaciecola sp.]MDP5030097.1 SAM-dependent methyltransferase [Paraglaciecola sp.]MDP5130490.1 SAM-dependent methyltransferase [Paraglaciecola sp.]